jgi:hypothetical protein
MIKEKPNVSNNFLGGDLRLFLFLVHGSEGVGSNRPFHGFGH